MKNYGKGFPQANKATKNLAAFGPQNRLKLKTGELLVNVTQELGVDGH